jgi:Ca-activated chloride channel homolog
MKSILFRTIAGVVGLTLLVGCASSDYPEGNLAQNQEQLRNQPVSDRSWSDTKEMSSEAKTFKGKQPELYSRLQPKDSLEFDKLSENRFKSAQSVPVSTFSIDVDTGSYTVVRRMVSEGQKPDPSAVRIEEMINYFSYNYPQPTDGQPVAVHVDTGPAPWAKDHMIVKVGIKGKEIPVSKRPASNLVFLIDVSGSMNSPDKLPLAVQSLKLLVSQLEERDRVSIVTYAGASGLALEPTFGSDKARILKALDRLSSGGSTNGGEGIRLAYKTALNSFISKGNNRVILVTDGDFNVGITDREELVDFVQAQAKKGVYLSIFGFGMDNLKDGRLEELSRKGNGNYGYIDTLGEAKRAFAEQVAGTLFTIAKDVKVQVEFNPKYVSSYRLIGYENRLLNREDFNNDKVDAGDMGSGHTVTALYEVVTVGNQASVPIGASARAQKTAQIDAKLKSLRQQLREEPMTDQELVAFNKKVQALEQAQAKLRAEDGEDAPAVDPLKYQQEQRVSLGIDPGQAAEIMTVKVRYKASDAPIQQGTSHLIELPVKVSAQSLAKAMSRDLTFACAVVEYGMVIKGSPYMGTANLREALDLAKAGLGEDAMGHRAGFVDMVQKTRELMPDWPEVVEIGNQM